MGEGICPLICPNHVPTFCEALDVCAKKDTAQTKSDVYDPDHYISSLAEAKLVISLVSRAEIDSLILTVAVKLT